MKQQIYDSKSRQFVVLVLLYVSVFLFFKMLIYNVENCVPFLKDLSIREQVEPNI